MTTVRRIVLGGPPGAGAVPDGVLHVVVDPAWTAAPGADARVVSLRDVVAPVLDRGDPFEEAFGQLDAWARALELPDRMAVDGISWWFRRRLWTWLWLADREHWLAVLDEILARHPSVETIEVEADDSTLADITPAFAAARGVQAVIPTAAGAGGRADRDAAAARPATASVASLTDRLLWRLGRHPRQHRKRELDRRDALLAERLAGLATTGRSRVLVLTNPTVHQVVGDPSGRPGRDGTAAARTDPFLGPVVERLRGSEVTPVVVHLGTHQRDDDAWPAIANDPLLVPDGVLSSRFGDPADDATGTDAGAAVDAALASAPAIALDVHGVDLGPMVLADLRAFARDAIPGRVRAAVRAARLIRAVGAGAVILINEYGLTEWVAAGRLAGVPVLAVQHGVIIPDHVGYRHARHPSLPLPTRTLVFGPYEARVLAEHGGYRADEVGVTGAPRLDIAGGTTRPDHATAASAAERATVRSALGVRDDHRMLVISTTHEPIHRRFSWPHALGRLLDAPLPGVHLVFKLHPAEVDDGLHRRLVEGLARAAGFRPPPVTVVRDIDLYGLLRAADAHLGLYSTVLSDAVAARTPNLIAATQARTDLVGYVAAGVARPVRSAAELRAALESPEPLDPERRRAFLADHFLPGDASGRIVAEIAAAVASAKVSGITDERAAHATSIGDRG